MSRYIDADALIAEYDRVHIGSAGGARKLIVDAPTADVVEVVRCKDCKYYIANYCTRDIKGRTNMFYMAEDDYCSYGERREGGNENK